MPRYIRTNDNGRHRCPLPPERAQEQPFIFVPSSRPIIAPWAKKHPMADNDEDRLAKVVERVAALDPQPRSPVWCWPHRAPVAIEAGSPQWLLHQAKDRACYSIG